MALMTLIGFLSAASFTFGSGLGGASFLTAGFAGVFSLGRGLSFLRVAARSSRTVGAASGSVMPSFLAAFTMALVKPSRDSKIWNSSGAVTPCLAATIASDTRLAPIFLAS